MISLRKANYFAFLSEVNVDVKFGVREQFISKEVD
jgi:hypothetical protein